MLPKPKTEEDLTSEYAKSSIEMGNNKQVTTEYMKCFCKLVIALLLGTVRMGANTTIAAVNSKDLRVFGFDNLYVCDASM